MHDAYTAPPLHWVHCDSYTARASEGMEGCTYNPLQLLYNWYTVNMFS